STHAGASPSSTALGWNDVAASATPWSKRNMTACCPLAWRLDRSCELRQAPAHWRLSVALTPHRWGQSSTLCPGEPARAQGRAANRSEASALGTTDQRGPDPQ